MVSERMQRQIDRLLDEAESAVDSEDWEAVRSAARRVLALDPENKDAAGYLTAAERSVGVEGGGPRARELAATRAAESSAGAHPVSFINGRYQVKRLLGEGGKKRVYLAHDSRLDRDVAFALIKTEGLDQDGLTRIAREAQAMGRLGDHPHIVSVYDIGEVIPSHPAAGTRQPYIVTQYMGGGDVEGLLKTAQGSRLPLEDAIRISAEVCMGLEFAHAKGVVHRDLKPGNIWLTGPYPNPLPGGEGRRGGALPGGEGIGTAKIGDFGLAVAIDRSRLTQAGMMVGTVSYMPPEQAMGGEVTPASDLYSLGCMLYELVTGRPPFMGQDHVAIIGQHLNTPPVAPSWHNPACPRPLEALILRLLAKDPRERPQSATDVLHALAGIDVRAMPQEPALPGDEGNALDSLAGGVFVGRQREMGELKAALEEALSGRGRLVLLIGEPGIGKTRTSQELSTYAGLRGAQVLWGRCYEGTGAPPYWPWVQAIRSYVRDHETDQLRSEMGAGAADIAAIASDVRERLPDLHAPPSLEPEQARFRLFDSVASFLKSASRHQPLALVLEDLHWADRPSLLMLEFLAQELSGARLLIIGTYRDVELSRQHPLSLTLGALARERLSQRVTLRGLTEEDVGEFIKLTTGMAPPAALVGAVFTQTEGNPLFVTETVRLLAQEGHLGVQSPTSKAGGGGEVGPWTLDVGRIPEGVREVIGRRVNRLSDRCSRTLTIASVIGREFGLDQLGGLIEDLSEERLVDVVEEALAARVIEELPRSIGRYQFTHALIQQTLAEELTAVRRARLHLRIGEVLEGLYGPDADAHAAELAFHFAHAESLGGAEKLVHYASAAGDRALATYAYEEALEDFQEALQVRDGRPIDDEIASLLFGQGRAYAAVGRPAEALDNLRRVFDHHVHSGHLDRALEVAECRVPHLPGQVPGESDLLRRALALVPPDSLAAARLQSLYGVVLGVDEGDYEGAQRAFAQALTIAQKERDETLEMQTLARSGRVNGYHLQLRECLDECLRAIGLARRLGDPVSEANSSYFAALALWSVGNAKGARLHTEAGLAPAERVRDRFLLANLLWAGETIGRLTGNFATARNFSERGLALMPRDPRLLGTRTLLEYEVGDLDEADRFYQRLLEAMREAASEASFEFAFLASVTGFAAHYTGLVHRFDFEIAKRAGMAVLSSPAATPLVAIRARTGLALMAVEEADAESAAEGYAFHKTREGTMTPGGMGSVDHLLGLLALTLGQMETAVEHFVNALAFCRKAGYRPEYAHVACDFANALLQRDQHADRARAGGLLDEALGICRDLGMRPLMDRVIRRRDLLNA